MSKVSASGVGLPPIPPSTKNPGFFVSLFENTTDRIVHTKYHPLTVEMKDYNVMINGQNFFNQPVKIKLRTYDNIRKIATGQEDGYTSSCLLDCSYLVNTIK